MATQPKRRPAGTPVGGQFAPSSHPRPSLELDDEPSPSRLQETSRGRYLVTDTVSVRLSPGRMSMGLGGHPHLRARANLAGARAEREMVGDRDLHSELAGLDGGKVTVLTQGHSGTVEAQEGTVTVDAAGGVGLLNKGASSKGRYLFGRPGVPHVLGYRRGYGHAAELAAEYRSFEDRTPELEPASFDDIPDGSDGARSEVAAVFVFDHPGFDGDQDGRGCVFFATDRDPAEVANGYMVAPPGSGLVSEHGSFRTDQLSRWGGRVADYRPGSLSFSDAMQLGNRADPYGEADMAPTWEAIRGAAR